MPLEADRIACAYGDRVVFDNVSIRLDPGRIMGLTGPSGTGKSSLARILTGLQQPDVGHVLVDGLPVGTRRGRMPGTVGLLHQSPRASTDPRMRLGAIITEPLGSGRGRGTTGRDVARDATALAGRVGVTSDLLGRFPGQVSDGQLQRACIARLLAAKPRYLVCDEPTAMLDAAATAAIAQLLIQHAATGVGVLVVSHDHPLLAAMCDTVVDLAELKTPRHAGSLG